MIDVTEFKAGLADYNDTMLPRVRPRDRITEQVAMEGGCPMGYILSYSNAGS